MADTLPPLSTNEFALLEIMKQGEYIADLGEHSRWSEPLRALVARGLVVRHDQFNHGITDAGRAAVEAVGDDDIRQLIEANNDRMRARQRAELAKPLFSEPAPFDSASVGPHVVCGILFFKMEDGSSISTNIGEPYASQIIHMWSRNKIA